MVAQLYSSGSIYFYRTINSYDFSVFHKTRRKIPTGRKTNKKYPRRVLEKRAHVRDIRARTNIISVSIYLYITCNGESDFGLKGIKKRLRAFFC